VRYKDYMARAHASILAHGGRYIARGGAVDVLEGEWRPERLVLLEFPTREAARGWWDSHDYQEAAGIRRATSTAEIVLLEGLDVPLG
jgi:uncharacterized protein (DUF1330 family)